MSDKKYISEFPNLMNEWHPTKNGELSPNEITKGSQRKVWWCCNNGHEWQAIVASRVNGRNCPYCSNNKVLAGFNDLETTHPFLVSEWNYEKNGSLKPNTVLAGSNKKVWWKCKKGHEWATAITHRTNGNQGCPFCIGKRAISEETDLATLNPKLAMEWHPTKNGELSPNEITKGSSKKVWWQCSKGHEWEASISSRATGRGCPYCSNNKVLAGYNDLETTHPFLVSEWNYEKNGSLYPNAALAGSKTKVWWKCKSGHEWEATISHRAVRRQGCPFCSGRQAISGETDLATLNPKLASEWHPTKNGNLQPNQVTIRSGKKIWWQCSKGHEWQATPHDRDMDKTNCPFCSARRQTSFPEQAIFYYVKQIFPNAINRYKEIFTNSMELDIFIPNLSIGIEYDGINWHKTTEEHSREKKKYKICKKKGITLIRIKENKQKTWTDVADKIFYVEKRRNYAKLNQLISIVFDFLFEGWNTKTGVTIDVERDRYEILDYLTDIENSLEKLRPDVVEEWNYEKNGNLLPSMFSLHSNESVWWKCKKCGHEWKTIINTRIKHGCPLCGNIERGKAFHHAYMSVNGTLAENNPELAQEWHTSKNKDLTPNDITVASPIKVWWKCKKCGHEWQSSPNNRSKGVGCPCCSGRVPKIGVNDLATVNPRLAEEWHPTKNAPLTPNMILPKSGKKVWWKCLKCGHEWQATVSSRFNGCGCPNCHKMKLKNKRN